MRVLSAKSHSNVELGASVRARFISSDRSYGAPCPARSSGERLSCGLHRVERLVRAHGLKVQRPG
jgi:putative transposase